MKSSTAITQQEFVVRESRTTNLVFAGLFLLVALISVSVGGFDLDNLVIPVVVFILPVYALVSRGLSNKISIRINHRGFFYYGKLITSWEAFYDIKLYEEEKFSRISDQFYLLVRYHKQGSPDLFGRKIRMSNTQDKADEEIIAAVRSFYQQWEQRQMAG